MFKWLPWQKQRPKPPIVEYGILETEKRLQGEVYHAEGTLRQSSGYKHRIIIAVSAAADFTRIDDAFNGQIVAQILRTERRDPVKLDATALFTRPPNFAIDIVAIPKVGDRQILLRRGLSVRLASMDSVAIAQGIGSFVTFILTDTRHDSLSPYLPAEFKGINSLYLITRATLPTCHFWHSVVLRSYHESANKARRKR